MRVVRGLAIGVGAAVAGYLTYVGRAWCRYGRAMRRETDPLLERFMPEYEAGERHMVWVGAPGASTFAALTELDLSDSALIAAIFRVRGLALGSRVKGLPRPWPLIAQMKASGWNVLLEIPGREIVLGTVTQPWRSDVVFRAVAAPHFAAFEEPRYVKIAVSFKVVPIGTSASIASTETRVMTTDPEARKKFRWYWSFFSPGMMLIRSVALRIVKRAAETRPAG